ncbi:hypothetical protein ACFX2H_028649 [Malus domestica]
MSDQGLELWRVQVEHCIFNQKSKTTSSGTTSKPPTWYTPQSQLALVFCTCPKLGPKAGPPQSQSGSTFLTSPVVSPTKLKAEKSIAELR